MGDYPLEPCIPIKGIKAKIFIWLLIDILLDAQQ